MIVEHVFDLDAHERQRIACVLDAGVVPDFEGELAARALLYSGLDEEQQATLAMLREHGLGLD